MKIRFECTYDTDLKAFSMVDVIDNKEVDLEHSGAGYYRIKIDGKQIGTIGCYCPGAGPKMSDTCWQGPTEHSHLSFSMYKNFFEELAKMENNAFVSQPAEELP